MAYDPERGVTYFFGGEFSEEAGAHPEYFHDVWEYDGAQKWREIFTTGDRPSARRNRCFQGKTCGRKIRPSIYGNGDLKLQWFAADSTAWQPIEGATSLLLTNYATFAGTFRYRLTMQDGCGNQSEREFNLVDPTVLHL